MSTFIKLVTDWAELISGVFVRFPLAGAIATAVATAVYIAIWRSRRISGWTHHCLLFLAVLLGWAIVVPVVGTILDGVGLAGKFALFIYDCYVKQPIFFIAVGFIITVLAVVWYFLPRGWRPVRFWRVTLSIAAWFIVILIGTPLLEAFTGKKDTDTKSAGPTGVRSPKKQ